MKINAVVVQLFSGIGSLLFAGATLLEKGRYMSVVWMCCMLACFWMKTVSERVGTDIEDEKTAREWLRAFLVEPIEKIIVYLPKVER